MRRYLFLFLATLFITPSFNNSSAAILVPASATATIEPDPATVKAAIEELRSLSRKERKTRLKELKKQILIFKANRKKGYEPDTNTLLLVILAILLPPLAVYLHQGEINTKFWITLVLWLLGWAAFGALAWFPMLPAIIYALIVILGNQ